MICFRRRLPLVLQMEATECGAASLAMVLAYHGRWVTLEEMRERCATSRDGVDALGLIVAAKSLGLTAKAFRREPAELGGLPMPQILHWCLNHFVVLERIEGDLFHINDPACGRRVVDREEFDRSFTGLVIATEPGPQFQRGGHRPSVVRTLLSEAAKSKDAMAFMFVAGTVGVLPAIAVSGVISIFIDHVIIEDNTRWAFTIVVALLGLALAQAAGAWLQAITIAALKAKIATQTATTSFWHALFLPLSFYARRSAGEVVSRLMLGAQLGATVAGPLAGLGPDIIAALIYVAVLALFDPMLAVAGAGVAALNLAVLAVSTRRVAEGNRAFQVAEGRAGATAISGFSGLGAYRALGREDLMISRWVKSEDAALEAEQRLGVLRALANVGPAAAGLLMTAVVLCVGALRVMDGALTLGGLIGAQMIAAMLNGPIASLARGSCQLQEAAGALTRLDDLKRHQVAPQFCDRGGAREASPVEVHGHLRLEGIRYGFAAGQPLLDGIDLTLDPGRMVALMGPSGCGKSTLARIAAGMIEPWSGRVLLDGVDILDWPQDRLRASLAYVGQSPAVFTGSVADNIAMFDHTLEAEHVRDAAVAAGLEPALRRHAAGFGLPLNAQNAGLSGGEIQRMTLARALARSPRLLVLDETTSALDAAAEEEVLASLRASGAAVLIVTHRPGTARRCDEVILLGNGGIAARGPPTVALAKVPPQASPEPVAAGSEMRFVV